MADYSVKSTQINPVRNAVTPQAGVTDQSGVMLGKTIAGAIGPAVELYGTMKEQDFKKEAEQEFRSNLGYTADPLGNQYAPMTQGEKEINQMVDRANQMGVMGAGANAALYLSAKVRTKIAKEPWFAERYQRASGQINQEYAQTVDLLNAAATKNLANQTEQRKALAKKQKEVYDNASESGLSFSIPIDAMDLSQLSAANQAALQKKAESSAYDLYLKQKGEVRADKGDIRADRSEARASAKEGRAVSQFDTSRNKEAFAAFNNNVLASRETYQSQLLTDKFYTFVDSGMIASNPEEAQRQFNAGLIEHLTQLRTSLNTPVMGQDGNPVFLDRQSAQESYLRLEAQANSYGEFIFGKKSNSAVVASQAKSLKDKWGLDVLKDPTMGRLLTFPVVVQQSMLGSLNLDADLRSRVGTAARGLFTAQDKAQAISNTAQGLPVEPALNPIATAAAIAAIDPTVASQEPQMFNNFLSQVSGQISLINPNERPQAYIKVMRQEIASIVGSLPDPAGATENMRKIAAQQIYDLQVGIGPVYSTVKYNNGGFNSDDPLAAQTVQSLNGIMKILETIDPYGPIKFGSRDALAQKFFGVRLPRAQPQ